MPFSKPFKCCGETFKPSGRYVHHCDSCRIKNHSTREVKYNSKPLWQRI
jgi:hypothetical protein